MTEPNTPIFNRVNQFAPNTDTLDEQIREIDRIINAYFPKETKQQVGASVIARAELVALFTEHSKHIENLAWRAISELTYAIDCMTTGDRKTAINENQQKLVNELLELEAKESPNSREIKEKIMSSIRNEALAISKGDLDILDEFMLSLGFEFYPGYDNKSEPANMPWSTRWCRDYTITYTDGTKGAWYASPDIASFLHQNLEVKSE